MPAKGLNRFALFEEEEEGTSPESHQQKGTADILPTTQKSPAFNDNPWQEVNPKGVQAKKCNAPILSIRNNNQQRATSQSYAHMYPSVTSKPVRHVSNETTRTYSTTSTNENDKPVNHNENWCGVCNVRFPNKLSLQNHVKQSSGHENYCNLCKRVFKDRNGLQNHVDHAIGHDVFCNLCLSAFNNKWGLRNHFENNYSVDHKFACLVCLEGFRNRAQMELHLRTSPKHIWCNTCHRKFRDQDERDAHWRKTTNHKHCLQPGCDFDGSNVAILEKHLKDDHFQCEACRMVFPSQTRLHVHLDTCGSTVQCEGCRALFPNQDNLMTHQKSCFACPDCEYRTDNEDSYLDHIASHGVAMFKCCLCSTRMHTRALLIKHLETGKCPELLDPTYLAQLLGKWWYSVLYMDLDIHAQIRQGRLDMKEMMGWIKEGALQPYVCRNTNCGNTFGSLSSLVFHLESGTCDWGIERLGLGMLERELIRGLRADSVV